MKVLVTGGTGHLGSWLVKALADQGGQVVVISRDPAHVEYLNFNGVELLKGDVTDYNSLFSAMKGVSQVFHLAALSAAWAKDPEDFDRINVQGTRNVMEAARNRGVRRVVVCSSAGNFGPSVEGVITERTVRKLPLFNHYERTKHEADLVAMDYRSDAMDVLIVYPTRVYGPIMNGKPSALNMLIAEMVTTGFRLIPGDGKAVGNYVYVHDVIKGMMQVMDNGISGRTYILGGENLSYNDFYKITGAEIGLIKQFIHIPVWIMLGIIWVQKLGTLIGRPPALTPDWINKLKYNYMVSCERAESELGYTYVGLKTGIRHTVKYFESVYTEAEQALEAATEVQSAN